MGCRSEIHSAVEHLLSGTKSLFTIDEVLNLMAARGTVYSPSTIRTQISSALCVNAPNNHPTRYPDFERVGPGMYRRATDPVPRSSAIVSPPAAAFEARARAAMEQRYATTLKPALVPGVPKRFDFVSPDCSVVGDAKFYTLVKGVGLPPAKYSTIAEYVWLLEKTAAMHKFLVFGNERRVPDGWLKRFGELTEVDFLFIDDAGAVLNLRRDASRDGAALQRP